MELNEHLVAFIKCHSKRHQAFIKHHQMFKTVWRHVILLAFHTFHLRTGLTLCQFSCERLIFFTEPGCSLLISLGEEGNYTLHYNVIY